MATSFGLQKSIAHNIVHEIEQQSLPSFGTNESRDNSFVARSRMNMIPSPAQAMTILRALNSVDLKNYPIDLLETLLPLLRELLRGEIRLYKSIGDEKFIRLNNIVHDVLVASKLATSPSDTKETVPAPIDDIKVDKSHVMQVLRAINAISQKNLNTPARQRLQRVKDILIALYHGNVKPLEQLIADTSSKESQYCTKLIQHALRLAYEENL